jgi:endonuclease G
MTLRNKFGQLSLLVILTVGVGASLAPGLEAKSKPKQVCTKIERAEADRWLWLNARDQRLSLDQNLPWGAPTGTASFPERQLIQRDYVIGYDAALRVPVWTAERVVGAKIGKVGRSDCFRKDPRLTTDDASLPTDYSEPIFDQGHMTPSGDVTVSKLAVHNSFIMSNMSPQFCEFNRGIWQILEEQVRRWAGKFGTVYVVNGSVFDRDGNGVRDADTDAVRMHSNNGKERVGVPTAFYKIVAAKQPDGSVETLSILLPQDHNKLDGEAAMIYLQQHVTTVAAIEAATGLRFFGNAPVQRTDLTSLWPYDRPSPRSLAAGC